MSMFTTFKRVFTTGMQHFWRNGWLSAATVSVMVIALSMVLGVMLVSVLMAALVDNLKSKLDVSVYFVLNTPEEEIFKVRNELKARPDVSRVEYVSSADARERFKERFKDDPTMLASISELEGDIFDASLNVVAKNPEDYQSITEFVRKPEYVPLVSKVHENREVITRLSGVITGIRTVGFVISIVLAAIAVLICFNTISMAIYTLRDEVGIMKLVGGTNWHVRGPFLIEGLAYGIVSSVATMVLFYPLIFALSPSLVRYFPGANLLDYYTVHFVSLWLILLVFGTFIGVFGSMVAIRKYLKV